MKKLIVLILILILIFAMRVTAFAVQSDNNKIVDSTAINVNAVLNEFIQTETKYSVDIKWTDMTFAYTLKGTREWEPSDHSYSTDTSGKWTKDTATVTVTNHSNADVYVDMKFDPIREDTGIVSELTGGNGVLAAGEENKPDEAAEIVGRLHISGTPNTDVLKDRMKIGTVKVTISDINE